MVAPYSTLYLLLIGLLPIAIFAFLVLLPFIKDNKKKLVVGVTVILLLVTAILAISWSQKPMPVDDHPAIGVSRVEDNSTHWELHITHLNLDPVEGNETNFLLHSGGIMLEGYNASGDDMRISPDSWTLENIIWKDQNENWLMDVGDTILVSKPNDDEAIYKLLGILGDEIKVLDIRLPPT